MPKFIAVHTLPFSEEQFIAQSKDLVSKSKFPKGFNWTLTQCAFGDHKFFCEWEAPSKESLEEQFKQIKMPYNAVYPVKTFNVLKGKLE
jgi:hypothetical protein